VDLHPDRMLRGIYSGATFTAEELVRADLRVETARRRRFAALLSESTTTFAAQAAAVEEELLFNCEHVVPQSWFAKDEPMRGDLHHLFACEPKCNSFRGNIPYFDFTGQEGIREACGRREGDGFEPVAGKGPAARATLYFLLRYPGHIGDTAGELSADRLEMLLSWHEQDPVTDYERHRNVAIAEIQGNRNPFIDDPTLARLADLGASWTTTTVPA
jgi:endonuclease I